MKLPTKTIERALFAKGYKRVIGVDEVGMGCLAGPVVVCAVMFDKKFYARTHKKLRRLRDSKLLSPKLRGEYAAQLKSLPGIKYQISFCYPKMIDRLNIYQAARRAMKRAVLGVYPTHPPLYSKGEVKEGYKKSGGVILLVDGPHPIANLNLPQLPIIKGDRQIFAIACASIIAKVHRDRMMTRYAKCFPKYGFDKHKGYGTKLHVAMLAAHGPTPLHRRSFTPVTKS